MVQNILIIILIINKKYKISKKINYKYEINILTLKTY